MLLTFPSPNTIIFPDEVLGRNLLITLVVIGNAASNAQFSITPIGSLTTFSNVTNTDIVSAPAEFAPSGKNWCQAFAVRVVASGDGLLLSSGVLPGPPGGDFANYSFFSVVCIP
jgi:hypothetical protein